MKISTNTKFLMLYLICFIIGGLGLVYYNDIFVSRLERDISNKIASSIKLKKDVKYRSKHDLRWFKVSQNEFFISGDKIFTGEKSSITLETIKKNQFSMEENSLIKLRGGLISLSKGHLTAFLNSKTSLYINGKKVLLDPSRKSVVHVKKIEGQGDVITVSEGKVFVEYEGQRIELKKDQKARIDNKNLILRSGLKNITLQTKLYNKYIYCKSSSLNLDWKSDVPVDIYKVRFYKDVFLKNKFSEQILDTNTYRFNGTKFKQDFYLHIIGIKDGVEVSQLLPRRLHFIATDYFPNINMKEDTILKGSKGSVGNSTIINESLLDSSYSLTVLQKHKKNRYELATNIVDTNELPPGDYQIKFCYKHLACSLRKFCNKTAFSVKKGLRPTLKSPVAGKMITISREHQKISFAWHAPNGSNYKNLKLVIKKYGQKFDRKYNISSYTSGNNNFTQSLGGGRYSWHISGTDAGVSFSSAKSTFKVGKISRPTELASKLIGFYRKKMKFKLYWNQDNITSEKITLEVKAKNKITKSILTKGEKGKRATVKSFSIDDLNTWRLLGSKKGKSLYTTSWQLIKTPSCNETVELKLGNVYFKTGTNGKVTLSPRFTWRKVPGAKSYLLKIFRFNQIEKVASFNFKTNTNSFMWKKAANQNMSWTITPVDVTGKKCITSSIGKYLKN